MGKILTDEELRELERITFEKESAPADDPAENETERCYYCGREGEAGSFDTFAGHPWCEMDDCNPVEDFFEKADRL